MRQDRAAPARLPVALTAVTVAGQCRERSPGDVAVFGGEATRFAPRFVVPAEGQALLAQAAAEGTAETTAELRSAAGVLPFRVALWRQRGGERIRLVASFSQVPAQPAAPGGLDANDVAFYAAQLRHPLGAVVALAEQLRSARDAGPAADAAGDVLAAAWRMLRLTDDLVLAAELGGRAPLRLTEIDIAALTRRVLRLASPLAAREGIALIHEPAPGLPNVLADETALWSVIESLLRAAAMAGGRSVAVSCEASRKGLSLAVASADGAAWQPMPLTEALAAATGATLAVGERQATLAFPPERCLAPV